MHMHTQCQLAFDTLTLHSGQENSHCYIPAGVIRQDYLLL